MVLAGLYAFTGWFICVRWKRWRSAFQSRGMIRRSLAVYVYQKFLTVYRKFKLDGPWFLWKLCAFLRCLSPSNNVINLVNIFMFSSSTSDFDFVCLLLALSAFLQGGQPRRPNTVAKRNRQLKIDIIVDFLCVALPLSTVWFVYQIPIRLWK